MISIVQRGEYRLMETKSQTKILILDEKNTFAWVNVGAIGEILVSTNKKHIADCILSQGNYRLYDVVDEPKFTDLLHLELCVGKGVWQGYLLPTGFPTNEDKRNKIIPTKECITSPTGEACLPTCVCYE